MDVSFIIPVNNAEKTIAECLGPLTQIKGLSFEVILIDDGSKDRTLYVADTYEEKFPLKIITLDNVGSAAARNHGLKLATGRYIYFYESEDVLIPYEFEKLARQALDQDLDICSGKGMISSEAGTLTPLSQDQAARIAGTLPGPRMFFLLNSKQEYSPMIWLRLYKRSFLEEHKIRFMEDIIHEDEEFTARCFAHAKKCAYFPLDFYRYRCREGLSSKNIRHKLLNPRSIPAFREIALHVLYAAPSQPGSKEVFHVTTSRCLQEILRRLWQQKKFGSLKHTPSWEELGLAGVLKDLPLKYRLPVYWLELKQLFTF